MKKSIAVFGIIILVVLSSCGPVPFNRLSGGFSDSNVVWKSGEANIRAAYRSVVSTRAASNVVTQPEVQALYDEWYTGIDVCPDEVYPGLGSLVTTITPTKFESSNWTVISNPDLYYDITFYTESVDFADPSSQSGSIETSRTYYDVLYIHFLTSNMELNHDDGSTMLSNWVEIKLPTEYDGLWISDLNGNFGPVTGTYTADRQHLGGSKYQFALDQLIPDPTGFAKIDHIIYGPFSGVELFTYGGDISFNTSQLTGNPTYGSSAGNIILIPWAGVLVDAQTRRLQFQVYLDTTDIIEVYDNYTPLIYSDDIVILTNRFWERFSIDVVQE